jgi:hypothetical protein
MRRTGIDTILDKTSDELVVGALSCSWIAAVAESEEVE